MVITGASDDPQIEARLEARLTSLYGLHKKEIDLSLDRSYRFLARLGNPHLRLPRTVHVAGTNGKGSTIATLRALLEASDHSVHVYTSPHLVHPTERIVLAGSPIRSQAFLTLLDECIEINNGEPITFFELLTCAALLAFSRIEADFLLLEVGMGGRFDATNVVHDPVATIITTISYDHTAFLGETLAKIAYEKSGIMKPGIPCIIGRQISEESVLETHEVFQRVSTSLSPPAPLLRYDAEWSSAPQADRMMFRYGDDSILLPRPSLAGEHQVWNAGAALAAFRIIAPDHFRPEVLSKGLEQIDWPGRLQTLKDHPFNALVPAGWEIVIDGGHNDSGGTVLAEQMKRWKQQDNRLIHLIVAMVDRKDATSFLKPLAPWADSLTVTRIEGEQSSYDPAILAQVAFEVGFRKVLIQKTLIETIVVTAKANGDSKARILIVGSLFFMGEILGKA